MVHDSMDKIPKNSETCYFLSAIKKIQRVNISETKISADVYFLFNKHFICTDFLIFCFVRISESVKKCIHTVHIIFKIHIT